MSTPAWIRARSRAGVSARGRVAMTASPSSTPDAPGRPDTISSVFEIGVTDRRSRSPEAVSSLTAPSRTSLPRFRMATRSQTRWTSSN